MSSPFANSIRQFNPSRSQSRPANPFMGGLGGLFGGGRPQVQQAQRAEPANPFADNEQYQALMEYQKSMRPNEDQRAQMQSLMDSMQPNQEQQDRMGELRTAFEGTGGFKDYRIQQMEQQLQQRQRRNPNMGMGLGSQRPQGMGMFGGFPQRPQPMQNQYSGIMGGMNRGYGQQPAYQQQQQQPQQQQQQMPQPQYQPYQNPYQQSQPQPQQYGGYGMNQQMGGFGGYGGMSNPYQPQQYGNQNNSMSYQQPMY
jgi:hypothetical protein